MPEAWPEQLEKVWHCDVGAGHSSPVVDGRRAYVLSRRDDHEVVSAIDLESGESLWEAQYPASIGINEYAKKHGRWPRSTPLVHGDRLVTLGANATLSVWDVATGDLHWRAEREGGVSTGDLFCGTSASPVFHEGRVIVHVGDDSGGDMVAFELTDGSEVWRTTLEGPGYATPIVVRLDGHQQLVTLTMSRVIGVSLTDGAVLWSSPFQDQWNENIVTPLEHDGLVVVAGVRRGTAGLRPRAPQGDESGWQVTTEWRNRKATLYMSSPVLQDGVVYGYSTARRGSFVALNVEDGETLWSQREPADSVALLRAGTDVVALTTGGEILIAGADREGWSPRRRYAVADSATWAHPVPLADGFLVKDVDTLTRWRFAP